MKKYTISVGAGLAILFLAYLLSNLILGLGKNEASIVSEVSKLVTVTEVKNTVSPINLSVAVSYTHLTLPTKRKE